MNIIRKLFKKLAQQYYERFGYPVSRCGDPSSKQSALLVYLSGGINCSENARILKHHQNIRQSRMIAHLLAELGYRVTVVNYNDSAYTPSERHVLAIVHPGCVADKLTLLPKTGSRISLRTGRHMDWVRYAADQRNHLYFARHGVWPTNPTFPEESAFAGKYDAIACFDGNGTTSQTFWKTGLPVYSFRNYHNPEVEFVSKNYETAKSSFICIVSQLHLLKGLDWVVEAFAARPDLNLHVCGSIQALKKSKDLLPAIACRNIHLEGFVDILSEKFRRLCRKAAFYISPTASDGCQGAILDAMAAGLVPIASQHTGVDMQSYGIVIEPCTFDALCNILDAARQISSDGLANQSTLASQYVRKKYSSDAFLSDWRNILDQNRHQHLKQ